MNTLIFYFLVGFFVMSSLFSCDKRIGDNMDPPMEEPMDTIPDVEEQKDLVKLDQICLIPPVLNEISGMRTWKDGQFIAHNDGGNPPELYIFSTDDCSTIDTFALPFSNVDWEAMEIIGDRVYIGDFGNNNGNRKDLKVYAFQKDHLIGTELWAADTISFGYAEQEDFSNKHTHNFDCEAMVEVQGKLFLFTKNRGDMHTDMYPLDTNSPHQQIEAQSRFNAEALVTDGTYIASKDVLLLLSYTFHSFYFKTYLTIVPNFVENLYSFQDAKRLKLELDVQFEAITYAGNGIIYLSNEETIVHEGVLFKADISQWLP